jgi:iron complex outermembrane receptor protein
MCCVAKTFWLTLCLSVLLDAAASAALAQPTGTAIRGSVRDESGAGLVGATVTATHRPTGRTVSVASDDRGAFELSPLDAGEYEVRVTLSGFGSQVSDVTLRAGDTYALDVTLPLAPLTETVTVTRAALELAAVPQAVDVVPLDDIQFAQRKVSLAESLRSIPGVFVQERGNFSESNGVRFSIRAPVRGVGIGIRGVQIVQDGIPLTTADGTTQPGNIDLGSAERIEIIRGPSSVLYGNSAGGVVSIRTQVPSSRPLAVEPEAQFGSDGYQRQQVEVSGTGGTTGYLVNVTRMKTSGFRDHSRAELRQANAVVIARPSAATGLRAVFNVADVPFAESPSTATLPEARTSPRSVRALAVAQGFGESSTQGQGGLTLEWDFGRGGLLRSTGWGMWRDVWNPIPNRIVDLGRVGAGYRSDYVGSRHAGAVPFVWTIGFDVAYQRDDRAEHVNGGIGANGRASEAGLLVDQRERVFSVGPFAHVSVAPRPRWNLTAGLRFDHHDFHARDNRLVDGNQSGGRRLNASSPAVGVTYAATPRMNIYGSFGTGFEMPTTQELSNRPSGEGGFNTELEPENLRTLEGGVRGLIGPWRLRYDLTGYRSWLTNALVQFERADEQEFFRNAGESSRSGVELLLEWRPDRRVTTRLAYTYQNFRFERFVTDGADFSGRREPGAPPHQLFAELACEAPFGLRSIVQLRAVDGYPVNNANDVVNWGFEVVDLRVGLDRRWRGVVVRPFFNVDNVFDERYNASTVPNALGGRYFEPSPGRQVYFGLSIGLGSEKEPATRNAERAGTVGARAVRPRAW